MIRNHCSKAWFFGLLAIKEWKENCSYRATESERSYVFSIVLKGNQMEEGTIAQPFIITLPHVLELFGLPARSVLAALGFYTE